MLKENFTQLLLNFTGDKHLIQTLWREIEQQHSTRKRHYHNLAHLEFLLRELQAVKPFINDWETLLFTLFYHDIVYHAWRNDNEEKSAELAVQRLNELQVNPEKIVFCKQQILATKAHQISADSDTNYFTDADLSILGASWEQYEAYASQVRKEYSIYPDLLYKPGRKKVLQHFLDMERIFKTAYFHEKYEKQARKNISRELQL
jgi:predicted metal-dependent HD superfamily phosphohydrolase